MAKEKLKISTKDIDLDEKSLKSLVEEIYEYFADGKSLFIFDNAERYVLVEKFLPLSLSPNTNKPDVLITSPNNLEWKESLRENIKVLPLLGDFTDLEATEFVKKALEIEDDSQNQDITELVKKLYNFPLALQQAVAYIKDTNVAYQKRNLEFKVSDYLKKYEETPKKLLNVKVPTGMHAETIFKTLEVAFDKIKNEEYGQQSLNMLNIISYFASSNISEEMFLSELASGDRDKLISITTLLEKYSIVRLEQGMLNVHGLVQQVRRLDLVEQKEEGKVLEEETLAKALGLLEEHMKDHNSVERYTSHIISAWNYASKYDKLIESFIVNDIDDNAAYTKYFRLIAEGSSYEAVEDIINKVKQNYSNKLKEVINAKDEDRGVPLHNAALSGDERIVKLLREKGADVNIRDKGKFTPLHLEALNGHIGVVSELLKKGEIGVNAQTTKGNTPLHLAAEKANLEVVKALIARNAKVDVKNEEGKVVSDLAHEKNHLEVENYIIQNQNKREVVTSRVDQNQQFTYKRRPGTSGIGGQRYAIELLMLFLLQGETQKEDKKIDGFYLATNMEEAGDFDDVVFKYGYNEDGVKKSEIVFLQAKHKENEKNEKGTKVKEKKVTIDRLLSQSEKGDFLLRKYFSTYRKIKQLRLKKDHLMFRDDIGSCSFVVYTNAVLNFDKSRDSVEKACVEEKYTEPGDILNFKGDSQKYYKLNAVEKVVDALRHSLDYEVLVKELVQSVYCGSIDRNKSILKDYQIFLVEGVIEKKNQREGKLRVEFLNGEQYREFSSAFFEGIKKKEFAKKSVDELKEELKRKIIKLPNNFGCAEENDLKLPLPSRLCSDKEIEEFLSELKLFVSQPGEGNLGEIIKQKMQSIYKVEQNDIDQVFSCVEYRVQKWWRKGDKYITESDAFFQESARVSINFYVEKTVTWFVGRITELDLLHKILQEGREGVTSQIFTITGLIGVGKSELARAYISKHKKDYDNNIIWIDAKDQPAIVKSFIELAQDYLKISVCNVDGGRKNIESIVEEVYRFFGKVKSLFVFDHYEVIDGFERFLPIGASSNSGNKPYILITSRRNEEQWKEMGIKEGITLGLLTEEEAISFVKKELEIDNFQDEKIRELAVDKLFRFPQVLRQGIEYIREESKKSKLRGKEGYTVDLFLQEYEENKKKLLDYSMSRNFYDHCTKTIFEVWRATADKIKNNTKYGNFALEILHLVAYYDSDNLPVESFFSKLAKDNEKLWGSIELLSCHSVIKLEKGKLNIYRLIQEVTRLELRERNQEKKVLGKAFGLIQQAFLNVTPKNCVEMRKLLRHLEVFLSFRAKKADEEKEKRGKSYILSVLTCIIDGYSFIDAREQKKKWLKKALHIVEEEYRRINNSQKITWLKNLLPTFEEEYGREHFETSRVLFNLGNAYGATGSSLKQKEFLGRALPIFEKEYGREHFETGRVLFNLGNAYGATGSPLKQKEFLGRALPIFEKEYGHEHFETGRVLFNLGNACSATGDFFGQKEFLGRALPIFEKEYGCEHSEVARILASLGNAYGAIDNNEMQIKLLERALLLFEKDYKFNCLEIPKVLSSLWHYR
ncbi:ankyrin repeat domain-containing protein [Wolbachia endosymbiont (group A) of Anomoia purmunda]|uniref:ankyrin repeat domain-containing protein n=1 Tax=Wolbachia endosymbiont (group A) of Anomoia purmunda TaxID=2953978 RepID=UPI00222E1FE2|nr:ankyrin repeat domain-containing protein [Wolbachia endosymbiont (group A) of Anomoia purmunda]